MPATTSFLRSDSCGHSDVFTLFPSLASAKRRLNLAKRDFPLFQPVIIAPKISVFGSSAAATDRAGNGLRRVQWRATGRALESSIECRGNCLGLMPTSVSTAARGCCWAGSRRPTRGKGASRHHCHLGPENSGAKRGRRNIFRQGLHEDKRPRDASREEGGPHKRTKSGYDLLPR